MSTNDPIELWPSKNPVTFHEDSKGDIKCSALGFAGTSGNSILLKWYKLVNGQKVSYFLSITWFRSHWFILFATFYGRF